MSFKIKDMQVMLTEMVEKGHVTEDSDLILATGDPAKGGQVYLITASGFAQREEKDTPAETAVFFSIKTPMEVQLMMTEEEGSVTEDTLVR